MGANRVTFVQAKVLKANGYPQKYYSINYSLKNQVVEDVTITEGMIVDLDLFDTIFNFNNFVFAPTYFDVSEWLRNEKDIHIVPHFVEKAKKYEPCVYLPKESGDGYNKMLIPKYCTFEEAVKDCVGIVIECLEKAN